MLYTNGTLERWQYNSWLPWKSKGEYRGSQKGIHEKGWLLEHPIYIKANTIECDSFLNRSFPVDSKRAPGIYH